MLFLIRRSIRTITNHVADGTPFLDRGILRPIGESEVGNVLAKANPLSSARRAQRARTLGSVLRSTSTIIVGGIAFFLILAELGVNLAPFIASAGVIGVALGFGAQSLVKDFLTGLFMLLEDQYGVGDVVDVGPANGTVEAVTLRITKIRDSDGTLWYVPNGTMLRVGNKTQGWATAVVEIDVDYFADLDQVRALLTEAASRVVKDPVVGAHILGEPTITGIERLSADAVTLRLKVKTSPAMQWEVARELRTATREALERADVPLAGQRDLMATHRAAISPQDEATPRDPRNTPLDDVVSNRDARVAATRDEPVPTEEPPLAEER
ncbi:mechanosensitive ion channel family protein [Cellulomonas sp. P5_C5]